ncbi:hypothetical protein HC752_21825 [Vibrio sp. S9_S30]|uniref:hypothetical protein n=1 Tax=Vibrio sp. S9_S30 TaxID=2720226 RepID=UPI001680B2D4|nr:hypothetical protein [Vibrio sp. S9_S30]MBD1559586.1 hypothetical protein [Vibrio sp. S9_S30]
MKTPLLIVITLLLPSLALASPTLTDDEFALALEALRFVLGEHTGVALLVFMSLGWIWTLVRQLIHPTKLAALHPWLVTALEFLAGNKGHAKNALDTQPSPKRNA